MQGHRAGAESDAAEPGAVLGFCAGGFVGWCGDDGGEGSCEGACAFECEHADYGVCVGCIQGFDGVGDGVDAGCCGECWRECHGEFDVVDYCPRKDFRIAAGRFAAVLGFAEDGRHFAAGVGCWDADVGEAGADADCFAEADGAAAADGDDAVGGVLLEVGHCLFGDVGGCVHGRVGVCACWFDVGGVEDLGEVFGLRYLLWC